MDPLDIKSTLHYYDAKFVALRSCLDVMYVPTFVNTVMATIVMFVAICD